MVARSENDGDGSVRGQGPTTPPGTTPTPSVTDKTPPARGAQSPQVAIYTPVPTNQYSSPRTQYAPNSLLQEQFSAGNEAFRQPMQPGTEDYLAALAKHMGHNRTVNSIWQDAVDLAKRGNISVSDALLRIGKSAGFGGGAPAPSGGRQTTSSGRRTTSGGGSSGGSGGMAQTSVSYDQLGDADLRDLANQISMEMLGKSVTTKQFDRIVAKVRAKEAANPRVTTSQSGPGSSVTSTQPGVTNADRQDVIQNILAKAPQYGDYQKATTLMGFFDQALNERLQNAG